MKKFIYCMLFIISSFYLFIFPQENLSVKNSYEKDNLFIEKLSINNNDNLKGKVLHSFDIINTSLPLGITVVNDTIIISSAGEYSQDNYDNYFYRFLFDGTLIDSIFQNTDDGWGYRDLAFDGTNILGSENEYVKKINLFNFLVVDSVQNNLNTLHRGLAYDTDENSIWSTNYNIEPLIKFNADNGVTIKNFGIPSASPYGIALDNFNNENEMYLWFAEPAIDGPIRITKIDTSSGKVDLFFNLSDELPEHFSGGLEIINNHPLFPDKVVAVLVAQGNPGKVVFIDITLDGKPAAPSNISAIFNNDIVTITWDDPANDLNSNPILIDSLQIFRNNIYIGSVLGGVEIYYDNISSQGYYRYKLVAFNDTIRGIPAFSNKVLIDMILFEDYEDEIIPDEWTIVNSNDDDRQWEIYDSFTYNHTPGGRNSMAIMWNVNNEMNDWFFTPVLSLDSLIEYNLQFYYRSAPSVIYAENLTVFLADTNDGINLLDTLFQHLDFRGEDFFFADILFIPPANGNYYIGFLGHSNADQLRISVDDISLTEHKSVPVELISFNAEIINDKIILNWSTASESNNRGFEIQRASDGNFVTVGFIQGSGSTLETKSYSFTDKNLKTGKYQYRLKQIDFNGAYEYSSIVDASVAIPSVFSLEQNYPNPFNPATTINFNLSVDSKVTLKIYNIVGEEVVQLINEQFSAGQQTIKFNASLLNSGIYFYNIKAVGIDGSTFINTKKMTLMK